MKIFSFYSCVRGLKETLRWTFECHTSFGNDHSKVVSLFAFYSKTENGFQSNFFSLFYTVSVEKRVPNEIVIEF